MKKLVTKKDVVVVIAVLVIGIAGIFLLNNGEKGKTATIKVDGEIKDTVSLTDEGYEKNINGVTISVADGEICVKTSTCKDKVCVRSGKISKSGEGIICAPNRVSIEINGENDSLPDALTG